MNMLRTLTTTLKALLELQDYCYDSIPYFGDGPLDVNVQANEVYYDCACVKGLAWDVFDNNERGLEIERIDRPFDDACDVPTVNPWFDGDDEALALVHLLALAGEPEALAALEQIGMDP